MTRSLVILAACAALALAGCAPAATATVKVTETAAAATTAESSSPTATVSQYASIISEHEQAWRDYSAAAPGCVDASYDDSTLGKLKQTACGYSVRTIATTSYTVARDLLALPEPPSEVKALVSRTVGVLGLIHEAGADTACSSGTVEACGLATMSTNTYARELVSILDAWKPYTG